MVDHTHYHYYENMKSRKFWELWGDIQEANAKLGIALYGVIALVIVLAVSMVKIAIAPKPVYYIPGAQAAGKAYPDYMPAECIAGFAENFIQTLANFTPATVEQVYQLSERYLSPALLSKIRTELGAEVESIQKDSLSSLFTVDTESEVKPNGNEKYLVSITGQKVIYLGKTVMKDTRTTYNVYIRKIRPTESNPYGLQIENVKQETNHK